MPKKKQRRDRRTATHTTHCPLARALNLVGDRWSLLLVRDIAMFGPRKYTELLEGWEGISTNILSSRLEELQEAGVIGREPYSGNREHYVLTQAGQELVYALKGLMDWSLRHLDGAMRPPRYQAVFGGRQE